jgi:hypothetical protein
MGQPGSPPVQPAPAAEPAGRFLVQAPAGMDEARARVLATVVRWDESLSAALGLVPGTEPVTLRLHPDAAALRAAVPLAVVTDGLVAYPRQSRREVDVLMDPAAAEAERDAALRHALAHRALVERTGGRLGDGFQEGLAAYLAGPRALDAAGVARLREAWGRDRLVPWSDLAVPGAAYLDPPLTYPEARSIAQFLVDQFGLAAVRRWLGAARDATGWRQALEDGFGQPPEQLEAAWRAGLQRYLDGGWRASDLYAPDLAPVADLLARGEFEPALALLEAAGEAPGAAALRTRAQAGEAAQGRLAEALAALEAGDYETAARAAEAARGPLAEAGAPAAGAAGEALARAQLGAEARSRLAAAERLPPWRVLEARALAVAAAAALARLGNDSEADRARRLIEAYDRRLVPAGVALVLAGLALLGWNLRRRALDRRTLERWAA